MARFDLDNLVFANKDVLREDWQPDNLAERDDEMDTCASALRPLLRGNQPDNLFLYGLTGVGKTAATHALITELLDAAADAERHLEVVELNCTGITSSYQVAVNLVNEMRTGDAHSHALTTVSLEKDPLPETGHPQKRVFRELLKDFESAGGDVIVVLDEIDTIGSDDDILYELPRARKTYDIDVNLGLIGISNDFKFRENLSPKVKDSLCEKEVHFQPYDAEQLVRILEKRADRALADGVLSEGVVPLCAAMAAQDSGSARQALRLLRIAGDFAENGPSDGDPRITEEHVRRAEEEIQRQQVVEGMEELTRHGKLVLLTVAHLEAEGETPERTKVIHQRYRQVSKREGSDPLKRRAMHDHLTDLTLQGVLTKIDDTSGRGNYNQYELDVELDSAIDALEVEFDDLTAVRETAHRNHVL